MLPSVILSIRQIQTIHLAQKKRAESIYSLGLKFRLVAQDPETAVDRSFAELHHLDLATLYFLCHRQTRHDSQSCTGHHRAFYRFRTAKTHDYIERRRRAIVPDQKVFENPSCS